MRQENSLVPQENAQVTLHITFTLQVMPSLTIMKFLIYVIMAHQIVVQKPMHLCELSQWNSLNGYK